MSSKEGASYPISRMLPFACRRASRGRVCRLAAALVAIVSLVVLAEPSNAGSVPNPVVTGPIAAPDLPGSPSHNYPFFSSDRNLPSYGYTEEEYFFQGTANRYTLSTRSFVNTPIQPTASIVDIGHPYMTRMVVRRPADPKRFNGTVLVEWNNATNGFDAENAWFNAWHQIMRDGYAWVGISTQNAAVAPLKTWNPTRYGNLDVTQGGSITDDALSLDIYSQAGQAIKHPVGIDPLGGLRPKHVISTGVSQSAARLAGYVNAINPLAGVYDGFVLISTLGNPIRTDLTVPVFKVLTEQDVVVLEGPVRQPDSNLFRTWEVAGVSHADREQREAREPLELRDMLTSSEAILAPQCANPAIGTRPPTSNVHGEVFGDMARWLEPSKRPPPSAPRLQLTSIGSPSVVARNSLGLALGGIQLSAVSVPTALNVGTNSGPGSCIRWGYYIPFSVAQLNQLYPSHDDYVAQVAKAERHNVEQGYIDVDDAYRAVREAAESDIGKRDAGWQPDSHLGWFMR
ncbi:hypothetical protein JQ617_14970 [Bradyrhizobium sp. KB893862 SZCCT0404]|uniref:alpha/beta hydrolase domain-containing protein n=1 Tax=Bradyrhizobium sp. KB893862 SZCCT0404 TaxID=2807672 RepID=UPI001BAA0129|nr:alpha/beta hydrolase domain-containing protein [Bradyrhizobium sp. KB893862 SZCCT0404]MBR1175267.1 hypothetical protein [Bradyrhizobium sp. KB893862 SZCCT0404]